MGRQEQLAGLMEKRVPVPTARRPVGLEGKHLLLPPLREKFYYLWWPLRYTGKEASEREGPTKEC